MKVVTENNSKKKKYNKNKKKNWRKHADISDIEAYQDDVRREERYGYKMDFTVLRPSYIISDCFNRWTLDNNPWKLFFRGKLSEQKDEDFMFMDLGDPTEGDIDESKLKGAGLFVFWRQSRPMEVTNQIPVQFFQERDAGGRFIFIIHYIRKSFSRPVSRPVQ